MNKIKFVLVTVLVVAFAGLVTSHNQTKSRILIIHSYNLDFPWVPQVNGGIQQYLANNPSDIVIRYQYMDLKNHPSCDFFRSAANDARLLIQDWQPQVIIIVDDLGQSLVGVNYLHFKPGADTSKLYDSFAKIDSNGGCAKNPEDKNYFGLGHISLGYQPTIIFAGVNGDVDRYGYNQADNVTGIFEHKNPAAIRQAVADLYRAMPVGHKPTSIQVLSDNSSSANSETDFFEKKLPADLGIPLAWMPVAVANTFDEWKQYVDTANKSGSMLLTANYSRIFEKAGDTQPMATGKLISWTEQNSQYPVLGAATNFITDGGAVTLAVPGYQQGQEAIRMALKVLSLNTPIPLPVSDPELQPVDDSRLQFVVGMNANLLSQQGINLPLIYEAFSRESNNFVGK